MYTHEDEIFFPRLSRLHRLYAKALSTRLEPHGVKPGYIDILEKLWQQDNVAQKELHATLDIEQATLSSTLQRMERDGIVKRVRNPKDRRMTFIVLTDKGRSLRKVVETSVADVHQIASTGLTVNDRRYFYRVLKQMAGQLESDSQDPALILVDEITD